MAPRSLIPSSSLSSLSALLQTYDDESVDAEQAIATIDGIPRGWEAGVWRCGRTTFPEARQEHDEICVILKGRVKLTPSSQVGGESKELKSGDVFFIPKGWHGTWHVVEEVEKLYITRIDSLSANL